MTTGCQVHMSRCVRDFVWRCGWSLCTVLGTLQVRECGLYLPSNGGDIVWRCNILGYTIGYNAYMRGRVIGPDKLSVSFSFPLSFPVCLLQQVLYSKLHLNIYSYYYIQVSKWSTHFSYIIINIPQSCSTTQQDVFRAQVILK